LESIGRIHKFQQITLNLAQMCKYKVITFFLLYRDECEKSNIGIMAYIQAFWNIFLLIEKTPLFMYCYHRLNNISTKWRKNDKVFWLDNFGFLDCMQLCNVIQRYFYVFKLLRLKWKYFKEFKNQFMDENAKVWVSSWTIKQWCAIDS
jgi:hypothetical protein